MKFPVYKLGNAEYTFHVDGLFAQETGEKTYDKVIISIVKLSPGGGSEFTVSFFLDLPRAKRWFREMGNTEKVPQEFWEYKTFQENKRGVKFTLYKDEKGHFAGWQCSIVNKLDDGVERKAFFKIPAEEMYTMGPHIVDTVRDYELVKMLR